MAAQTRQPLTNHRRNNRTSFVYALIFCLDIVRPSAASQSFSSSITSAQKSPTAEPFSADAITNFLRNRCGSTDDTDAGESPALWSYEGTLTDPMTGKVIAEVEGLEVSKPLPMIIRSQVSDNKDQSGLGGLFATKMLCSKENSSPTPSWDSATTVLSRRLFCYRRPSSKRSQNLNNKSDPSTESKKFSPYNSLLISLRLRPDGPLRHLSTLENTAIYDSAVTYISRNQGREMVVFSERGGRAGISEDGERINGEDSASPYIMGSAQRSTSDEIQSSNAFDFAIHAQKGTLNSQSEIGGPIMLPPLKLSSGDQMGSEEVVISPPRSQFLQFGKGDGNGSASERKFGSVRETYRYSFEHNNMEDGADGNKLDFFGQIREKIGKKASEIEGATQSQPKCIVRYTRYGEAPPWYAPGRSCTLELRGKRIALPPSMLSPDGGEGDSTDSLAISQHMPSLALWAASKCNFWSGWPQTFSGRDELMRQYYQMPPKSENELARQAIELFCNERQPSIGPLDDYPTDDRKQWLSTAENALSKMQSRIQSLSKSFIMSELPKT